MVILQCILAVSVLFGFSSFFQGRTGLARALFYIHLKHLVIAERIRRWKLGSIYLFFLF
jgi:hypothetical protein